LQISQGIPFRIKVGLLGKDRSCLGRVTIGSIVHIERLEEAFTAEYVIDCDELCPGVGKSPQA
jgi:hypothetical protein